MLHLEFCNTGWARKTERCVYQAEEKFDDICRCFDTIHEHAGQTDKYRTTAGTTLCIASSGKNLLKLKPYDSERTLINSNVKFITQCFKLIWFNSKVHLEYT